MHLESKISNLEDKLKLLDEFPSNKTIIQEAQQSDSTANKDNTLSGIWQFMKMNRRLQAAEEAIDRVMSILNEFMGSGHGQNLGAISNSIQDLSAELQQLKEQLNNSTTKEDNPVRKDDDLASKYQDLVNKQDNFVKKDDLNRYISALATKNELKDYVKWPALEDALQVKKDKSKTNLKEVNIMKLDDQSKDTKEGVKEEKEVVERPKSSPAPPTQSPVPVREVPKTAMVTEETQVYLFFFLL